MATRPLIPLLLSLALLTPAAAVAANEWTVCHRSDVKALRIFTVGEATLSRLDCAGNLLAPPLRLEFRYFRDVPGDAFAKAAMNFLRKNLDETTFDALAPRFERFNSHYQDIGDGDIYRLIYRDQALELFLNDTPLARETGNDFASAYLQIWFGEDPYSDSLKASLLGR